MRQRQAHRATGGGHRPSEPVEREGAWERLSGRVQHAVCLVVLVVVAFGFYAPAIFGDLSIAATDNVQWRAMAETILEAEAETGEPALWTPSAFGGMPAFMIYYPTVVPQLDTIVKQLRPVAWPAVHFLVLLVGTYLLVVLLTRQKLAALLAACAYGLTTYMPIIIAAGHNTKFIALAYAPWLALAFAYALQRPRLLAGLFFAIALGVNLRANHVQITYYVTFLLGVWWIVEGVGALRHDRVKAFLASTGWLALGSVLGLLMVAQPYLPVAEFKAFTTRGGAGMGEAAAGLDWAYAMNWSQGVGELVTLLVAGAYGGGGATYWGPKIFTAGPHYVGGVVLLLAVLALWRMRRNVVWALGIGAALMVAFALGENLPVLNRPMFDYFPLFNAFRVPETWLSMVSFALAVLAGLGLLYVVRSEPTPGAEREKTRSIYTGLAAVGGLVLVLLLMKGLFFDFARPGEVEQVARQISAQYEISPDDPRVGEAARQYVAGVRDERADLFSDDAVRTLIFLALAGLLLAAYRREKVPAWVLQGGLALLVIVDLWGVDRRYFNEEVLVRAPDEDRTEMLARQIPRTEADRFVLERAREAGGMGRFRVLSFAGGSPMENAAPAYLHESLGGYSSVKLRLYQDFIDRLFVTEAGLPNDRALDLMNTRYVIARGRLPGTEVVYQDQATGLAVLENPDALPRAFLVGETEVVASRDEALARLGSADFDPRRTALLSEPIAFETTPIDSASTALVELVEYAPEAITWRVRTDAPRLLVASEVYYPAGWEATVDGEPAPIHRVDYLLRGVPVPEGTHTVTMRFEPRTHRIGVWTAGVSTAVVYGATLFLLGFGWYRRREDGEGAWPGV